MVGSWSDKEKQDWLLQYLREEAKNAGKNEVIFAPVTVTDGEDEFTTVLFDKSEQEDILYALYWADILEIKSAPEERPIVVKLIDLPRPEKSPYARDGYKTLRDVLLDYELRNSLLGIILRAYGVTDKWRIKNNLSVKVDVVESWDGRYQNEKILLLEELGIVKADWDALRKQTYRTIGNRRIPVQFYGEKVGEFVGALIGLSAIIKPKALQFISETLIDSMPNNNWYDFFVKNNVPDSLLVTDSGLTEMLITVFTTLVSTGNADDFVKVKRIFEELVHPLFNGGDEKRAADLASKISGFLKYDDLMIRDGKVVALEEEKKKGGPWDKFPEYVDLLPKQDFYLHIKAFAAMLYEILEAVCGGDIGITNERLNHIYTLIHHYFGVLLERQEGSVLKDEYAQLPESILDIDEDFDMNWQYGWKQALSKVIAASSRKIILGGDPGKLTLPEYIQQYQKDTAEATTAHKRHVAAVSDKMLRNIDERMAKNPLFKPSESPKDESGKQPSVNITINNAVGNHASTPPDHKTGNSLKGLVFDDGSATLTVGDKSCRLPPYKNEHYFCKEMYSHQKGEPVDWSIIYPLLGAKSKKADAEEKRVVYDTMLAVNRRVQDVLKTDDKLFDWREKTVTRIF